jgi:hypothetical protein
MLTEKEIQKVFAWEPYRDDWPVNRNERHDNIQGYFGNLISTFLDNLNFNCIQMETGGMSNYMDFMCYRKGERSYSGHGILVLVNLCAPIAAYGITQINVDEKSWGNNGISPEEVGIIKVPELKLIEQDIIQILVDSRIEIIDHAFASQTLPKEVYDALDLPFSDKYLYGLFQMTT